MAMLDDVKTKEVSRKFTRRYFLKASATVTATIAVPTIVPSSVFGASAPSNRINMGFIGTGGMGIQNLKSFIANPDVQAVAVCDVETYSNEYGSYYYGRDLGREPARKLVDNYYARKKRSGFKGCAAYIDFRQLLARDDIDAVAIVTPDHWHAVMSIMAAKAGKDIYCEKPLSLTIAEGRAMVNAVRRYGRVLQTGSWQRSNANYRHACELVRNGRLGKLQTIIVGIKPNKVTCQSTWQPEAVPESLDYDMWLGPALWAPYTKPRCHYSFRYIFDYSGGQMTNFGAHDFDIAQWALAADDTGPIEIKGKGQFPRTGLFDTAESVDVEFAYANGVKMVCKTEKTSYVKFIGSKGSLFINRKKFYCDPPAIIDSKTGPNEVHLYKSDDHFRDFLDCVKLRRDPIANVEVGHRSATVCHLGNIAMLLGGKLKWDPQNERFINDDQANKMLSRVMRSPWRL